MATTALAQVTPAASYVPPDDTPSIRVGATIFSDYSVTSSPDGTDADGNTFTPSAFNVARSYLNITGQVSHVVLFRITPDVARETGTGSSLNGSLTFRIKYAYTQFNLDDWMPAGTYARLGIQQMPWLDFVEGIYRYRFQGTLFPEREGYFASADAGASFRTPLPGNYGDVHVGYYNGENYNKAEVNDQKATMMRGTLRPFARSSMMPLRGLRVTGFYDADHYVKRAPRTRAITAITFEHPHVNAAFEYLTARDQTSATKAKADSHGFSLWATPKTARGWEGLLRYDHLVPNETQAAQSRTRAIVGLAYWFPHQGNVSSALMFDYDGQTFDGPAAAAPQRRFAVHGLIQF